MTALCRRWSRRCISSRSLPIRFFSFLGFSIPQRVFGLNCFNSIVCVVNRFAAKLDAQLYLEATAKATAQRLADGLHRTHRKVRAGVRHSVFCGWWMRGKDREDSLRGKAKAKAKCGFFATLRMTAKEKTTTTAATFAREVVYIFPMQSARWMGHPVFCGWWMRDKDRSRFLRG